MRYALLTLLLLIPALGRADTITHDTGEAIWAPPITNESFNVSFDWDATTESLVPNSVLASPPFTASVLSTVEFVVFTSSTGAGIQLFDESYLLSHGVPIFGVPGDYSLPFDQGFFLVPSRGAVGLETNVLDHLTVVATPEPPVWLLSLVGLALILFCCTCKLVSPIRN